MNAPEPIAVPTVPGTPFAGGLFIARFCVGVQTYALIAAPKAEGEVGNTKWNGKSKRVDDALSVVDGQANTAAMAKAGSELAKWAQALRIGGHDDWYLPSRLEALLLYAAAAEIPAADAFERDWYWTSTQYASESSYAWCQFFDNGYQNTSLKGYQLRARAVRRVAL